MSEDNDVADQIRRIQRALTNAASNSEKDAALDEFHRLGKTLSVDDLKTVIACGCGPSGERGIESWPCVTI